jgi:hypothetical protein
MSRIALGALLYLASPASAQGPSLCEGLGPRGYTSIQTLELESADEDGVVLSGSVCFLAGADDGSVHVVAGLPIETTLRDVVERRPDDFQAVEAWTGTAAPGEVISWTATIPGPPGESNWALATVRGNGGEAFAELFYGYRSGYALSAPMPQELAEAAFKALLHDAGLEGASPEEIREVSPSLYWRLTNDYRTPRAEVIPIIDAEGNVIATYERLPELPDSLRSRYNNPRRALRWAHIVRIGGDPTLEDRARVRLKPEARAVRLPEEFQCQPDPTLSEGAGHDAYFRCLRRQADWYRARGLVEAEGDDL